MYLLLIHDEVVKKEADERIGELKKNPIPAMAVLLMVTLFVIFWMYGEPLLLEEVILEY